MKTPILMSIAATLFTILSLAVAPLAAQGTSALWSAPWTAPWSAPWSAPWTAHAELEQAMTRLAELTSAVQDDPADSLFRAAQTALRRSDNQRAAELFASVRSRFSGSPLAKDAAYWEAFSRHRIGGVEQLETARELLAWQQRTHPNASSAADARSLAARIEGQLASRGDAASAQRLTERAQRMSTVCPSEDEDERLMVLDALLTMDSERALPTLKSVLARRDECSAVLRRKAVFLVSRKRSNETEDILLNALRTDPDREVREQAVFWLGQVNSEKSTTALIELLRTSSDDAVLEKAVFSLAQQRNERAHAALRDMARRSDLSTDVRGMAIFWLGSRGSEADSASDFLMQLYPTLRETELKERVLYAVAQRKSPEAQRFLTALAMNPNESMDIRRNALYNASRSGMTLAQMQALYRKAPEKDFKNQVIFAMANLKSPESVDVLFEIAKNDPDREMRKQALFWLGSSKDPRVPAFLQEIINK